MKNQKIPANPECFDEMIRKLAINDVIEILQKDVDYSRERQEQARFQHERLIWQDRVMHVLSLINRVRTLGAGVCPDERPSAEEENPEAESAS